MQTWSRTRKVPRRSISYAYDGGFYGDERAPSKSASESSHTFQIGLRYALFNAARWCRPPPAPARGRLSPRPRLRPPAPTWCSSTGINTTSPDRALTDRLRGSAGFGQQNTLAPPHSSVSGYTDTSGTPVSITKACPCAAPRRLPAELVADGVPSDGDRNRTAYGETHLLVPTGAGRARAAEPPRRNHHPVVQPIAGGGFVLPPGFTTGRRPQMEAPAFLFRGAALRDVHCVPARAMRQAWAL